MALVISIEGNIGCGKSTLLELLRKRDFGELPVGFVDEDVSSWENFNGTNTLKEFYAEPKKNAFTLQFVISVSVTSLLRRAMQRENIISSFPKTIVTCRSIQSIERVFVPVFKDRNYLTPTAINLLDHFHQNLEESIKKPHLLIYIKSTPETCFKRLIERGEKNDISLDYLHTIHTKHEDWFKNSSEKNVCDFGLNCYTVTIDGEQDKYVVAKNVFNIITNFIKKINWERVRALDKEINQVSVGKQNSTIFSVYHDLIAGNKDRVPPEILIALENIKVDLKENDVAQGLVAKTVWNEMRSTKRRLSL